MASRSASQGSVSLPKILLTNPSPQLSRGSSPGQGQSQHFLRNRSSTPKREKDFPNISQFQHSNNSTIKLTSEWKDKFDLLGMRKEVNYKRNSVKQTLLTMSPQLDKRSNVKDSILKWGKEYPVYRVSNGQRQSKIEDSKREDEEILDKLDHSFEIPNEDSHEKPLIGANSPEQYYVHYKKLSRVVQQNRHFSIRDSTFTNLLLASQQKMMIPCKLGLIRTSGNEEDLTVQQFPSQDLQLHYQQFRKLLFTFVRNMKYGDSHAKIISMGLNRESSVQNFNFNGNRISKNGADELLSTISKKAKVLEFADNLIGNIGCQHISSALRDRESKIETLNLEGNRLGDASISLIINALSYNKSLKVLNLSKNYITDKSADLLVQVLDSSTRLNELYLHWNSIKSAGGSALFNSLVENESLKVFDISCNSLGSDKSCADELSSFLIKNKDLRHLDISNNFFRYLESIKISEALSKNKSIYGIHFSGNSGYIDSRGFLIVKKDECDDLTGQHVKRRINGCKVLSQNINRNVRDTDLPDCCWICEGWKEETINWKQEISSEGRIDPLFIHFNFEDYKANYHGKQDGDSINYTRMFPPGNLFYLYSSDEVQRCDQSDPLRMSPNPEGIGNLKITLFDGKVINSEIECVNSFEVKKSEAILDEYYKPLINVLPRTSDPEYVAQKQKKKPVKWTFPISIFAKWRPDDSDLLNKCFEFDWENCKIPQKIKKVDDQERVKEFLRSKYQHIKDTYKHFASIAPIQDIWCIQNGPWLEFIQMINIIDQKVKDADINLKWTATISGSEKGNHRNPERGINRHQLMEVLVRIAEEKYILKYQKANTFIEAIEMLWEEHLKDSMVDTFNQQKWRTEKYWVEDVDLCLKHYRKVIDHIYKKFSKQKVKPGQAPFMCLEELQKIILTAGISEDEHFGSGVTTQAFNFSMMTQIDELQTDRIFQMSQLEFYEALTRIAEEISLPATYVLKDESIWTWEMRKEQPLYHKLESLLIKLLETVCDPTFKASFPKSEISFVVKKLEITSKNQ